MNYTFRKIVLRFLKLLNFLSEMNKGKARKKMSEAEKREKVAEGLRRKKECDRIALDVVTRNKLLVITIIR